jgi:hypothetical protein
MSQAMTSTTPEHLEVVVAIIQGVIGVVTIIASIYGPLHAVTLPTNATLGRSVCR